MPIAILLHTPTWVWLLFAALVGLGLSQARPREATLGRVTLLPVAMVSLSVVGVLNAFGPSLLALGSWGAGLVVALVFGRRAVAVRGARWSTSTRRLQLPASWLPLVLIVGLFLLKYAAGASVALHPELAADARFACGFSLAYGLASGIFLARGLSLRAVARAPGMLQPA